MDVERCNQREVGMASRAGEKDGSEQLLSVGSQNETQTVRRPTQAHSANVAPRTFVEAAIYVAGGMYGRV